MRNWYSIGVRIDRSAGQCRTRITAVCRLPKCSKQCVKLVDGWKPLVVCSQNKECSNWGTDEMRWNNGGVGGPKGKKPMQKAKTPTGLGKL